MNGTVPNKEQARIPREKLVDYLLNEHHPQGRAKARFFRSLGYNQTNADRLAADLFGLLGGNPVTTMRETPFGVHYVVEGPIRTPSERTVQIVTVWLVEHGNEQPRLITAYPGAVEEVEA